MSDHGKSMAPKPGPRPVESTEGGCTLGREVIFDGKLTTSEDLVVLGRVNGHIIAKGSLVIGREAVVEASIEGQRIVVHGRVNGNVTAAERIELGNSSHVRGDVTAPAVQINEGSQFQGRVRRPGKSVGSDNLFERLLRR